jgi:tRNA modification GTPase
MSDELVLALRQLHPTPWLELHMHGGAEVARWLFDTFEAHGIRSCGWQEFVRRTTGSDFQASAWTALARAPTLRAAAILLDQCHGALGLALDKIHNAVGRGKYSEAAAVLQEVLCFASLGRHLTTPWRVVIAGAPNVGKSSLVNALTGFERSIVAATPGTTRDVVGTRLAIDGWPVDILDTAGLRAPTERLEGAGVDLTREAVATADLCLWVVDAGANPVWPDFSAAHLLQVVNKIDLPPAWDVGQIESAVHVSAKTGTGLPALCEAISRALVPLVPIAGAAIPFSAEICDLLQDVHKALVEENATKASGLLAALQSDSLGVCQITQDAGNTFR